MSDVKRYQTTARHSMQETTAGMYIYYADHARIVAEKDAEIKHLREVLETARFALEQGTPSVDKEALVVVTAALMSSACGHQRHAECRFAACVCECHNQPEQKDGE